jgi:hypothetical protein
MKLPEVVTHYSSPAPSPPPLPPVPLLPAKAPATGTAPALPSVLPPSKAPAGSKHDVGGGEESFITEGTVTFGDDPPSAKPPAPAASPAPAKPAAWGAKPLSSSPPAPASGTLTLTPPPMPPSKPSGAVTLSAPPAKLPAPPAPPSPLRPTVPVAVRLKERIEGVCGPGYEVRVTPVTAKGKTSFQVNIAARSESEGNRLLKQLTPILSSPEFSVLEINVDVTVPSR